MDKKPILFSFFVILAVFFLRGLKFPGAVVGLSSGVAEYSALSLKVLFALFVYFKVTTENIKKVTSFVFIAMGISVIIAWFKLSLFLSLVTASSFLVVLGFKAIASASKSVTAVEYFRVQSTYMNVALWMEFVFPIIMLILAYLWLKRNGVKSALVYGSYILLVAATVFVFMFHFQQEKIYSFAFFASSLGAIQAFLFVPVLHLFYLSAHKSHRLKVKIWTEVFFALPLIYLLKMIPTFS